MRLGLLGAQQRRRSRCVPIETALLAALLQGVLLPAHPLRRKTKGNRSRLTSTDAL